MAIPGRTKAIAICQSSALFNEDKAINFYFFFVPCHSFALNSVVRCSVVWVGVSGRYANIMVHDDGALWSHAHDQMTIALPSFFHFHFTLLSSSPISVRRFSNRWAPGVQSHVFVFHPISPICCNVTQYYISSLLLGFPIEKLPSGELGLADYFISVLYRSQCPERKCINIGGKKEETKKRRRNDTTTK